MLSQTPLPGREVREGRQIGLVVARPRCHPSYTRPDVCLDPDSYDYDCWPGEGNGPDFVYTPVRVVGPDVYRLDANGDGWGCEASG